MMNLRHRLVRYFLLAVMVLIAPSCQTVAPAVNPAPPAELPSALVFPTDVSIDVSKVASSEVSALRLSQRSSETTALVGAGGELSTLISLGPDLFTSIDVVLTEFLTALSSLEIPVSEETTSFEADVQGDDGVSNVKIDFATFDLDGDGDNEDCAGHTAEVPICYRIWLNDDPLMAGLFEEFPTEDNAGAGRFRLSTLFLSAEELSENPVSLQVIYDHTDSENKSNELLTTGTNNELDASLGPQFTMHVLVTQEGPDATALKTFNMSTTFEGGTSGTVLFDNIGQWLEDEDFWMGSVDLFLLETIAFSDACAQISTGNLVDSRECEDRDLSLEGVDFVDRVQDADVALPDDLPEDPTSVF